MKLIVKLQNIFSVTKSELIVVTLIITGLIIGLSIKMYNDPIPDDTTKYDDMYQLIDSIYREQEKPKPQIQQQIIQTVQSNESITSIKKKKEYPKGNEIININTASRVKLMKLPGVGIKTAQKIIDYRKVTTFIIIEDIKKVKGIGPKKFAKMKEMIIVK